MHQAGVIVHHKGILHIHILGLRSQPMLGKTSEKIELTDILNTEVLAVSVNGKFSHLARKLS